MTEQSANPPVKTAEEVVDRVVAALSPRFDTLDKSIAGLKGGQTAHTKELQAIREMLDSDTASVDEIDRLKGKLERRLLKVERTR